MGNWAARVLTSNYWAPKGPEGLQYPIYLYMDIHMYISIYIYNYIYRYIVVDFIAIHSLFSFV